MHDDFEPGVGAGQRRGETRQSGADDMQSHGGNRRDRSVTKIMMGGRANYCAFGRRRTYSTAVRNSLSGKRKGPVLPPAQV